MGFEPTNDGFADRGLSPLGYLAKGKISQGFLPGAKDKWRLLQCPSVFTHKPYGTYSAGPFIGEVTFLHLASCVREPASCYRTTVNY